MSSQNQGGGGFPYQQFAQYAQPQQQPQGILDPLFGLRFAAAYMANNGWSTVPVSGDEVLGKALMTAMNGSGDKTKGNDYRFQYQMMRDQYEDQQGAAREKKLDERYETEQQRQERMFGLQQQGNSRDEGRFKMEADRYNREQEKANSERQLREQQEKARQDLLKMSLNVPDPAQHIEQQALPDIGMNSKTPEQQAFSLSAYADNSATMNDADQEPLRQYQKPTIPNVTDALPPKDLPAPRPLELQEQPQARSDGTNIANPPSFLGESRQQPDEQPFTRAVPNSPYDIPTQGLLTEEEKKYIASLPADEGIKAWHTLVNEKKKALYEGMNEKNTHATQRADKFSNQASKFIEARDAASIVFSAAKDPTPFGDHAMIFAYMKVVDPGSTVREGEYQQVEGTGSLGDRAKQMYNMVLDGQRLTPEQRADIVTTVNDMYKSRLSGHQQLINSFKEEAKRYGYDESEFIRNITLPEDQYSDLIKQSEDILKRSKGYQSEEKNAEPDDDEKLLQSYIGESNKSASQRQQNKTKTKARSPAEQEDTQSWVSEMFSKSAR